MQRHTTKTLTLLAVERTRPGRALAIAYGWLAACIFLSSPIHAEPSRTQNLRLKRSVVLLEISPVHYNPRKPWIQEAGKSFIATGLVLPGKKILTLADDVRDAALIEVSQYSSYTKALANVIRTDHEANLALLSVSQPGFFKDLKALPWGADTRPGKFISSFRVDQLFHIYYNRFRIQEINVISNSGFTDLPLYSFHADESFPYGGVLLCKTRLCGLISYSGNDGNGQAIIPSVIRTFLANKRKISRSNFASQGFRLRKMNDPIRRQYYRLPPKLSGAMVTRILSGTSAWGILRKKDILLSIDGVSLDNLGFYEHPLWGRQPAQLLLSMKGGRIRKPGERLSLSVFRRGKVQRLKMKLKSYDGKGERIPRQLSGQSPYLVESGIVFLELSVPLLKHLYGNKWRQRASLPTYLFSTQRYYEKPAKDRILIIGTIFPDPATRGLEGFSGSIVQKINGKKFLHLKDLRKRILELAASGKNETAELSLYGERPLYLDLKNRKTVNRRIFEKYSIPRASLWENEP